MRTLTDRALNLAQVQGASYADIRIVRRRTQDITVKNGIVEALSDDESQGFGVRVVVDGAWGFASSALLTPAEVDRITALAVQIARASALFKVRDVRLGPPVAHTGTYRTPVQIDPWQVSLDQKIDLLLKADQGLRATPGVMVAESSLGLLAGEQDLCQHRRRLYRAGDRRDAAAASRRWPSIRKRARSRSGPSPTRSGGTSGQRAGRRSWPWTCRATPSGPARRRWRCSARPSAPAASGRSSWALPSSRCRSTSRAATRSSWTGCSAPRPATPAPAF